MAAGCGGEVPVDPCAGQMGACLTVDCQGDIGPVDGIDLEIAGAVRHSVMVQPSRAPTPLPVAVGVLLPDVSGAIVISGAGLLGNSPVGAGKVWVGGLAPGAHLSTVLKMQRASGKTCVNGVMDGDEVGVDCGGSCPPCGPDGDGDGDPDATDCKPMDPKIHHPTASDPAPESANCCGYALGKTGPEAAKNLSSDPACHAGTCGDGVDQDCNGVDVACKNDFDCDTFAAAAMQPASCKQPANNPPGTDCDDCDPAINPLAPEICDQKDNNCNGLVDETCVACDLDGDGYQRMDAKNGCPNAGTDKHPGMVDCNDEDAGVFPGSTKTPSRVPAYGMQTCNGKEGGSVVCALRTACHNVDAAGKPEDADCDGMIVGCPAAMDADHDGFPAPMDCNDNSPTIFPGAPDLCGNGIAEDCMADHACMTDADGDGYDVTVDCDDSAKSVHPWALELCNGRDDDCDGLVDEGNPDDDGIPMVKNGAVTKCTYSDVGDCAAPPGDCVCSAAKPPALYFNFGKRTACPGETSQVDTNVAAAAPRCYLAAVPGKQTCDPMNPRDGDCDGRVDAPDGKNLDVAGMPCWPGAVGQCAPAAGGKIAACDMSKKNCFAAAGLPVNPWPVCDNTAICPVAEKCNGLDDDCNGSLPANELDGDKDGYLECGPCAPPVAMGKMCGDCNDMNPNVHPGAPEVCDGVDDDCNPATVDNANDATCGPASVPPGPICCGAGGCKSSTTLTDCGGCGMACATPNATPQCKVGGNGKVQCQIGSCNAGFGDCDGQVPDGCEINLTNTLTDCGGCNMPCSANHIAPSCVNGACVGNCTAPYLDCNMNKQSDGCEVNPQTDPANCGGCGMACSKVNDVPACAAGSCTSTCNAGFANCDNTLRTNGCNVNTTTNAANCGACGTSCASNPAGHLCIASACGCNAAGDCDPAIADGCTGNKCSCGAGPPCNPATSNCSAAQCLLLNGQPCTLPTQCLSNNCAGGTCA